MNTTLRALSVLLLATVAPAAAQLEHLHVDLAGQPAPWSEHALELAGALPVQDGGRVKPLQTYANFTLLRFNGRSSVTLDDGRKLGALPWLLDVFFQPEVAAGYPVFKVDDVQAVQAIGVAADGKQKRDRFSFEELRPGIGRLFDLARQYGGKEEKDRTTVEQQVTLLAAAINDYLRLQAHFDFARYPQDVSGSPALVAALGGPQASFSLILERMPDLLPLQAAWRADPARGEDAIALGRVLQTASEITNGSETLAMLPPTGTVAAEPDWHSPADLVVAALQGGRAAPDNVAELAGFEIMALTVAEPARFEQALAVVHDRVIAAASARGEYQKIPLELTYYRLDLIANSLAVYILGFVLCALMWLAPRRKLLYRGAVLAATVATALLIGAIVIRCMIRGRPPVSTLYETLLFVTAVGSLLLLATEWISRQRTALSVNTMLGVVGLFLANGYETLDKKDTMPQLVAVLDTNFWLATHVTAITVGYAAGMVAATIATVYLVARLFGIRKKEPAFGKGLIRMTYGALCFGLIFSVVGTILGGIWANESWGRFWGWDPKENGALLICLVEIVILHGRMGGYLRDFGIAAATAFLGTVIAFSWFGVNLLGVGLHSYGFTSGIHRALWTYYFIQWGLIAVCGVQYGLLRSRTRAALAEAAAPPEPQKQPRGARGGRAVPATQGRAP